jgi:hypothetical protein
VQSVSGPPSRSTRTLRPGVVAGPFLLFLIHAALFGSWIVDDAGISFSYARSLAHGFGLVAQPGQPPVEGFSNFLWVVLLAPTFWLHLFDTVWTPKALAVALTFGTFLLLDRSLAALWGGRRGPSIAVLSLLALHSGFVIWSVSGLENPLYVFLAVALVAVAVGERGRLEAGIDPGSRPALLAGLAAAGLALTRPDGVIFAPLYPAFWLLARRERSVASAARALAVYAAALGGIYGAFLLFRRGYFGDWVPNTFRAKGGPTLATLGDLLLLRGEPAARLRDLGDSIAGPAGVLLLAALGLAAVYLAGRGRFGFGLQALFLPALAAAAAYALLPRDWMGEHRFATPFYPLFYAFAAGVGLALLELVPAPRRALATTLALAGAAGGTAALAASRSLSFAAAPTVPFTEVQETFGTAFNGFAERLGVGAGGSFLLPDLGGTLWTSKLRVVDLAGLCDPVIARTLTRDRPAFHAYVFEQVKPTFIHMHEGWTLAAALGADPRLERDYVPLLAYADPVLFEATGERYLSGDFVRREIAEAHPEAVAEIRRELMEHYRRKFKVMGGMRGPMPEGKRGGR